MARSWFALLIQPMLSCRGDVTAPVEITVPYTWMPAEVVVGQADFTSGLANRGGAPGANTLQSPAQTLVVNGKLIIADAQNNRVLIYNQVPTANGASADVVLGQPSFTTTTENQGPLVANPTSADTVHDPRANTLDRPSGLASDGVRLFVLDRDNHRVLIYNQIPVVSNAAADIVIGHASMTDKSWCGESAAGNTAGVSADCFSSGPTGLAYDAASGMLIVYDSDNDRVLLYNRVPAANGARADVVIGQPDFTRNATNQGGAVGPRSLNLSTASGLGTFAGKLLIADRLNNRILVFNEMPRGNDAAADVVIGQSDFLQNLPNQGGGVSARGFSSPRGAQVDERGRLFVPDAGNARVLVFNRIPTSNNAMADVVIGQPDFTSATPGVSDRSLQTFPYHVSCFRDHFVVTDGTNHRVLIYRMKTPSELARQ